MTELRIWNRHIAFASLNNQLTQWSRVLLEKLMIIQLGKKFVSSPFMELEGSLSCSQQLATGAYPEPDESSPQLPKFP
jgi:hypothetical protein